MPISGPCLLHFIFIMFSVSMFLANCERNSKYPYSLYLDREKILQLSWRVSYRHDVVYFHLTAAVRPGTWFGVGFSDYGDPENADFVLFWTDAEQKHHFQDAHTDSKGTLSVDDKQDYFLTHAHVGDVSDRRCDRASDDDVTSEEKSEGDTEVKRELDNNGCETVIEFQRKFDTCDDDDYVFDNGTTHIIFFMSHSPLTSLNGLNVTSFSPGLQRVQLLKPDIRQPKKPDDTWTFEVTTPNVAVPAEETTYWWYTAKLPPLKEKHHIIQYEGVIQKSSEGLVHHMEVFHCEVERNEIVRFYSGPGQAEGKPPELAACRKVIGAWAMGATALSMPEEAGIPIGGPGFSRYVMLEVHYNNPGLIAEKVIGGQSYFFLKIVLGKEIKGFYRKVTGATDSSGIRFYVTSQLRPYDSGIMELGLEYTNKMAIPPHQERFSLIGYCVPECTAVGLPPRGINIYASQLHAHLTGRRLFTKHIRNGKELPELNRDNHYSPHFQEIRQLPVPVNILPGDLLITTCEDTTMERENVTVGGFAITDEMCVNYVHYYPVVNLEVCKSSIDTNALQRYFKFMHEWQDAPTSPNKGDRANYNSIQWTPLNALMLNVLYSTSPLSMQCNQSDGNRFPGYWENMPVPQIEVARHKPSRKCFKNSFEKATRLDEI